MSTNGSTKPATQHDIDELRIDITEQFANVTELIGGLVKVSNSNTAAVLERLERVEASLDRVRDKVRAVERKIDQ